MADQGWVDQANLLTTWDNNNSPYAWVDQANLLTTWDNNNSPYAWVDQANLLVVWSDTIPLELLGSSAANMFEQLSDIVSGYQDHESAAQKTKRCEDHFGEDYDDDSLAKAFYDMEN